MSLNGEGVDVRLLLDHKARFERDHRRKGGHGGGGAVERPMNPREFALILAVSILLGWRSPPQPARSSVFGWRVEFIGDL